MKTYPFFIFIPVGLVGCGTAPPIIQTQVVTVPVYVPVPENLLEVPPLVYPPQATFGQVEGILYDGLQVCRGNLQAIRGLGQSQPDALKPIPPTPEAPK